MSISLSSGVRNALTSIQSSQASAQSVQGRLATGKRVNSAVDGPVNFFTSGALNQRANALSGLMDGMSNAVQTIQAASRGIDAITKLVNSAQSTIKQAQSDAAQNRPSRAGGALATVGEATVTNKSLKDVALDKLVVGAAAAAATATSAGSLGATAGTVTLTSDGTTYSFTTTATTTVRDFVNEVNKSGIATAFVDEKGQLNLKGTGSEELLISVGAAGVDNTDIGFEVDDAVATSGIASSGITSSARSNLIQQFNELRTQIDQLAKDSGFNGLNLLAGDRLSVTFNEKTGRNQSKVEVQGSTLTADNLGIQQATNTRTTGQINFQNDADLDKAATALTASLSSLRSLSSTLGANLAVVQARQDFTKDMINTLKVGADNLVLADTNEEGANLLALQTRQQLSQTALSLSSQADQAVLRLF